MRQADEHRVEAGESVSVEFLQLQRWVMRSQARVYVGGTIAGLRVAGRIGDVKRWVLRAQSQQFSPRVAGGPDNPNFRHTA